MFFIILTFFAALFIEGLGSLVSVIGISALFGANPIIISLAVALDVGKIVVVSLLYTYWRELSKLMKAYALAAAAVTMIITSAGAAGYLTGEFQKSIMATREGDLKVAVMKEQQAKYELRKKQIDDQVAALPTKTTVNQRLRLMRGFQSEQKALDAKIAQIDKDLPALQVAQIGTEAKAGPIVSISKAFDIPMEEAVSWVIGMIIFVFDPLAIFLIIAGNFLWARRKAELKAAKEPVVEEPVVEEPEPVVEEPKEDFSFPHPERASGNLATFKEASTFPTLRPHGTHFFEVRRPRPHPIVDDPAVMDEPVETEYEKYEAPMVLPTQEAIDSATVQVPPGMDREELREFITSHAEPAEQQDRSTYVPTGILKPIEVRGKDDENDLDNSNFIPLDVDDGPVPVRRQEIVKSSLGLVLADPQTIVDAQNRVGFRKSGS